MHQRGNRGREALYLVRLEDSTSQNNNAALNRIHLRVEGNTPAKHSLSIEAKERPLSSLLMGKIHTNSVTLYQHSTLRGLNNANPKSDRSSLYTGHH